MKILYREKCSNSSMRTLYVDPETSHDSKLVKIEENSPRHKGLEKCKVWLRTVFLPEGFPDSVSEDYIEYQVWDTVQAFASSISGSLATTAVLKGVGVGDSNATPLAATLTWLLRDGAAMLGRIVFAAYSGSGLDYDCKKWRMFADVLNDMAMCVELVAGSLVPRALFLPFICVAGVGRSLVGVAGGATKAAVAQHQAKVDNMADLAAKDGSQETLVNLVALVVNLCLLPYVASSAWFTGFLFVLMTLLHVYANYRAVSSLLLRTLNIGRLSLILESYLSLKILSIKEANQLESVLLWTKQPNITIGASLSSTKAGKDIIKEKVEEMNAAGKSYILFQGEGDVKVFMTTGAEPVDYLAAYIEAYFKLQNVNPSILTTSPKELIAKLESVGWRTGRLSIPSKGFTFLPVE